VSVPTVDLQGKVAIITGSNTGIGIITAKELARMGAHVIVAGRNTQKCEEAVQSIKKEVGDTANVEFIPLDLASLKSVREFAGTFKAKNLPLHILVNNAGVMALPTRETTEDGFEMQMGVNHLGHFLLTNLLLDVIKSSAPARIVNLSSAGHAFGGIDFDNFMLEKNYGAWKAYGNSKLANILFTKELAQRLDGTSIEVNAVHPGYVATELSKNIGGSFGSFIRGFSDRVFAKSPEDGAKTSIYVAVNPELKGVTAKYFADCAEKTPSAAARNMEDAKKLWEVSEKLTGLQVE